MGWKHEQIGTTDEGGVQTIFSIDDDATRVVVRDYQSAAVTTAIQRSMQVLGNERLQKHAENGYLAARIPKTMYVNWRRAWEREWRGTWTWPTYAAIRLNNERNAQWRHPGGGLLPVEQEYTGHKDAFEDDRDSTIYNMRVKSRAEHTREQRAKKSAVQPTLSTADLMKRSLESNAPKTA